jgi:hypothetical protein
VHGNQIARRTLGLEAAIVDNEVRELTAFDRADRRRTTLRIAGPAALIVAKLIKIAERRETPRRLTPKDGLDLLRLLQVVDMSATAGRLRMLAADPTAGDVTRQALDVLRDHGCRTDGLVATLAATAMPTDDWDTITQSVASLATELVANYGGTHR